MTQRKERAHCDRSLACGYETASHQIDGLAFGSATYID